MKRIISNGLVLIGFLILVVVASSCNRYSRSRHGGYDSQTWIPRKHYDIPLKTYTGYPRQSKRRRR